jgi:hypothetical protein
VRASCSRWRNHLAHPPLTNPRRPQIRRRFSTTPSLRQVSFLPWRCTSIWRRNVSPRSHGPNRSISGSPNLPSDRNRIVPFLPSRVVRASLPWTKSPLALSFKNLSGAHQATPRLPSFLQKKRAPAAAEPEAPATPAPITIGRLRMPGTRSRGRFASPRKAGLRGPTFSGYAQAPGDHYGHSQDAKIDPTNLTESNLEAFSRSHLLKPVRRCSLASPMPVRLPH